MAWPGLIRAYASYLPLEDDRFVVTLLEGNTPLVPARKLAKDIGFPGTLYLKFDGQNPTASFKDRGMTYAVSKAHAQASKALICASTGNTSASAAAYAARAGMQCLVLIPDGKVALGKLSQAAMHGAKIIKVKGNFDTALHLVKEVVKKFPLTLVNSLNPFRIEGQKTAAFEVCEVLGDAPDYHALPVGNAGNICAYWKGYREFQKDKRSSKLPRMLGFQAAGAAPMVLGKIVENPETVATAIRIGNPASWEQAKRTLQESNGLVQSVTDAEILSAYQMIAQSEGVFCEPASAAGVAGLKNLSQSNFFSKTSVAVCTLTGHGLKDPETALQVPFHQTETTADLNLFSKIVGDLLS